MPASKKESAPFIEDLMRMAEGAFGTIAGMRSDGQNLFKQQLERFFSNMDLVSREELEVVKDIQAKILERLDALEGKTK